jgi:hypothetical protein
MRVLICGRRNFGHKPGCAFRHCLVCDGEDFQLMKNEIWKLSPDDVVIEGGARGADRLAGHIASEHGLEVVVFPAQWVRYGRAAGVVRNQQMLDEAKPDFVLAFHHNIAASKGTKDMVQRANRNGIPVRIIP